MSFKLLVLTVLATAIAYILVDQQNRRGLLMLSAVVLIVMVVLSPPLVENMDDPIALDYYGAGKGIRLTSNAPKQTSQLAAKYNNPLATKLNSTPEWNGDKVIYMDSLPQIPQLQRSILSLSS
jgi:hypothetical protein